MVVAVFLELRMANPASTLPAAIKALLRPGRRVSVRALNPGEEGKRLITAPRMGGEAYAEKGDEWPVCGGCGEEMAFVAQFNALEHLWVFHYCFVCNPWRSNGGQDKEWSLRKYASASADNAVALSSHGEPEGTPIPSAWDEEEVLFAPTFESARLLVSDLEDALGEEAPVRYQELLSELGAWQGPGTRVEGYADWEQAPSSPLCGQDGRQMVLLSQLTSDAVADVVFGDVGSVYLMVCPDHLDDVTLEMQSG